MSDIFQEVDEEVRREKLQQLWERHSNLIIALALLVVLAVGGWRGYQWWDNQKAAESGAAFEAAVALGDADKPAEAQAAFAKLANDGTSGYRTLARFREAAALTKTDVAAAVKAYDALAADSAIGRNLQDAAAVRAGLILVDTAPLAELTTRLEPLTAADRPFRHIARELLALSAYKAGDKAAAQKWFDLIATDTDTPAGTRQRVEVLMTLAGAEKAKT
ncbi:MAG: tetratricopeptide repeat protein [Alphaproteobacteria bacterium]|nr:tetratricopeptide repeat protein [Alphaproteobacteria bacterium]